MLSILIPFIFIIWIGIVLWFGITIGQRITFSTYNFCNSPLGFINYRNSIYIDVND